MFSTLIYIFSCSDHKHSNAGLLGGNEEQVSQLQKDSWKSSVTGIRRIRWVYWTKKEFASGIPIQKRQSYQFRSIFGMEFMVVIVYFWVKMQKKISFVLKVCVWSRLLTKFKLLRCSMCKIDKVCAKVSSWRNMQFFAERCERMKSVWSCHFGIKTMCWPSVFWDKNRHE